MGTSGRDLEPERASERPPGHVTSVADVLYPRWVGLALAAVAVTVAAAWLLLAATHLDDRFMVDHVSGVRIALARYANAGTLYPELYRDGLYGGTRFMPLPIVLHAASARLTGGYLVAGRLLGYLTTAGVVAATFAILRGRRCPPALNLGLSVLLLTTSAGLAASMNMRSELLPLVLQLVAVWIVSRGEGAGGTVAAGGLSALALLSKLSAIWALIAIVLWLLPRDRRRLAWYLAAYVGAAAVLFAVFATLSDGRILENVLGLSTAGVTGVWSLAVSPYRFVHLLVADATTTWALVPVAIVCAWVTGRRGGNPIYAVSAASAFVVTLIVLLDVGTGANQLVDLVVLIAIVIGVSAGSLDDAADVLRTPTGALVGLAVLWVLAAGSLVTLAPPVLSVLKGESPASAEPLADIAGPATSMLSEDPYVPISLGQEPVVLDPFMLPRLAHSAPEAIPDLIRRIERREFDLVVLVEPLEPVERPWWTELDLGIEVARAIARSYRFLDTVDGYYVYEPGRAGSPS